MKTKFNIKVLIVCLVVVYLVAFIGSIFTSSATDTQWYQDNKPPLTPPSWVFPVVWNILFFLIALSLYFAWINSKKNQKHSLILVYGINFVLNILWSVLYFGLKNPLLSFIEIILLWASIWLMIFTAYKINKKAGWLLVPYLVWVAFAIILNFLSI